MGNEFKFSVVIPVYNTQQYLDEAIQSIINQDIGFLENVQLILVDDGSSDNSYKICLKYQEEYPKNIIALTKENGGQSSARNLGLEYVDAEYITFLDSDDKLSLNALSTVYDFFLKHYDMIDVVSIPVIFFDAREGNHQLNYKFKTTKIVDLLKTPQYPQLAISSTFFKKDALRDYRFDTDLVVSEDSLLINKIILEKKKIGFLNNAEYFYRKRFDHSSTIDNVKSKNEYFIPRLNHFSKGLINFSLQKEGYVPSFIQYVLAYDIQWFYGIKDFPENFTKDEINEFWKIFFEVLSYIDDEILKSALIIKRNYVRSFLIYLKNLKDFHIETVEDNSEVYLKTGDSIINNLHMHKLHLNNLVFKDGFLNFSGTFASSCYYNTLSIEAIKTFKDGFKEKYNVNLDSQTNEDTRRILGIDWYFKNTFDLNIPVEKNEESKIDFYLVYEENNKKILMDMGIKFRDSTHFSNVFNFAVRESEIIYFKENSLNICPYSEEKINELRDNLLLTIGELIKNKKDLTRKNNLLIQENEKLTKNLAKNKKKNEEILNSTSWKITRPLRNIKNYIVKFFV